MVRWTAGDFFDEHGSRVARALAVNLVAQPVQQAGEVSSGESRVEVAQIGAGPGEKLRGEEVAQSVGWEITDKPFAPVAVLQAALRVIGNRDAQRLLVSFIPGARQIGHGQIAA